MFFWTLSDKNWPFLSKTFRFVSENCSLRDLKRVVENYIFLKNTISFFSVLSASEIEQKFLAFPRKIWPACQNCLFWFYVPRWTFFKKKEIFRKKSVFYQFGTWGKNKRFFVLFFAAVVSKLHFKCPYNHFDIFFPKYLQLFLTFWHLSNINFSLSSWKIRRGFQNFIFSRPEEHLVEKKRIFWAFISLL